MTERCNYQQPLTKSGRERRDAMLSELTQAMERVQARRARRRRAATTAMVILLSAGVVYTIADSDRALDRNGEQSRHDVAANDTRANSQDSEPIAAPARDSSIRIVRTDRTVLDRYRANPTRSHVQTLSDDELLDTLARLDRPVGLIRMEGRTMLTGLVADDRVGPEPNPAEEHRSVPPPGVPGV